MDQNTENTGCGCGSLIAGGGIILLLLFIVGALIPDSSESKQKTIQGQEPTSVGYTFLAEGRTMSSTQAYQQGVADREKLISRMTLLAKAKGADERIAEIAARQSYFKPETTAALMRDITIKARNEGIPEDIIIEYNRGRISE